MIQLLVKSQTLPCLVLFNAKSPRFFRFQPLTTHYAEFCSTLSQYDQAISIAPRAFHIGSLAERFPRAICLLYSCNRMKDGFSHVVIELYWYTVVRVLSRTMTPAHHHRHRGLGSPL